METIKYTTIDKSIWPEGEWSDEPDKVQWSDEKTGLPCLAVRNSWSGNWCGYVGVDENHPAYKKDYSDEFLYEIEVHGGLTYADLCNPHEDGEQKGICHVPGKGEPDHVWWLGFDCAHAWDYSPQDVKFAEERGWPFTISHDSQYRSLAYVKNQCQQLAEQLIRISALSGRSKL